MVVLAIARTKSRVQFVIPSSGVRASSVTTVILMSSGCLTRFDLGQDGQGARAKMISDRPLSIGMIGLRGIPATYGGIEAAVEGLSVELVRRGHSVTVYGRRAYTKPGIDEYRGVQLRRLPQINTKHLEAASHTVVAGAVALAKGKHDVIHIHATGPALFSFIPRLIRTACVTTVQGLDWQREKWGPVASRVLRLGAHAAVTVPHETIVVSRALERDLRERTSAIRSTSRTASTSPRWRTASRLRTSSRGSSSSSSGGSSRRRASTRSSRRTGGSTRRSRS